MTDDARMVDEAYVPPTLTVIGSLATDTRKEIVDSVNGGKSPTY
ncbi:MAG TPA: lasso RiPP family leader peptide-containing protein [Thermoleophilaceae bacterium]|jgi:hypothetical protein